MKELLIVLFLTLTITACFSQNKVGLETDNLLTETFDKTEIEGLELMVDYVDKMVLEETNETDCGLLFIF